MKQKTDIWMPLYIGDYLRDTMHLSRSDHGSYMLLIMHYWSEKGPLPDDDVYLANVARCPLTEWGSALVADSVRNRIAKFFRISNGKWVHARIESEILKVTETKIRRQNASKVANEAKKSKSVTESDTETVLPTVPPAKKESQNTFREVERPDLAEVQTYASIIGLATWKAEDWFNEMEGCGWKDFHGRDVVNWKAVLTRVKTKWEADGRPSAPPSNPRLNVTPPVAAISSSPGTSKARQRWQIQQEIDAVEKRIGELRNEKTWARSEVLKKDLTEKINVLAENLKKLKTEFDNAKE